MESNYTYSDAVNELQQIVSEIETGDVNVDELADKIKRASQLIHICKSKLTASEEEVNTLLAKLQETSGRDTNPE
ncbi:Exodeoxyribonuclease VII small subunit [Sphingobacterium nematocida]|uniref:Exodeoxyribonuclease 7 small subunit n=1 Tax=Sphingobacterium nematocida TaxID=1513896 RepID=A0A1T5G852_9SPHI|nr:exodeoxyribonuclease VII small subunit [Sphingobacterium nematocida]SKC04565.1 Exodeoxyribonuclease VII small subunit [Sphingobacterium nematocida]